MPPYWSAFHILLRDKVQDNLSLKNRKNTWTDFPPSVEKILHARENFLLQGRSRLYPSTILFHKLRRGRKSRRLLSRTFSSSRNPSACPFPDVFLSRLPPWREPVRASGVRAGCDTYLHSFLKMSAVKGRFTAYIVHSYLIKKALLLARLSVNVKTQTKTALVLFKDRMVQTNCPHRVCRFIVCLKAPFVNGIRYIRKQRPPRM